MGESELSWLILAAASEIRDRIAFSTFWNVNRDVCVLKGGGSKRAHSVLFVLFVVGYLRRRGVVSSKKKTINFLEGLLRGQ